MKLGSLFTGYGGLDLAAAAYFGAETVWVSDIDPGACRIIAHRYPDVPNLGDITAIDWATVEPVDILTGGWPCQPWSNAGKRLGAADERALWPYVADAVRALRPRHVLLENVAAIASAGELARAAGDLAALGYLGSWRCLRAADVGAPHGRARIFIVATDTERGGRDGRAWQLRKGRRTQPQNGSRTATDTDSPGRDGRAWQLRKGRRTQPQNGSRTATDTDSPGLEGRPTQSERGNERAPRPGSVDAPPDATGDGRDEGRPQPTGVVGRPDAALGRDASPTNAERVGRSGRRGIRDLGSASEDSGCEAREQRDRDAADDRGAAAADAASRSGSGIAGSTDPRSSLVGTVAGPGDRVGAGDAAARVSGLGRSAGVAWGAYEPAIRRWETILGRVAPAPTEASPRGSQRLSPSFVEWLMGLPAGWVTDVPGLSRNAQLKALGNGVVPQQAYAALWLLDRRKVAA